MEEDDCQFASTDGSEEIDESEEAYRLSVEHTYEKYRVIQWPILLMEKNETQCEKQDRRHIVRVPKRGSPRQNIVKRKNKEQGKRKHST